MDILYQAFLKKSIDMSNFILPELDHDKNIIYIISFMYGISGLYFESDA